MLPLKAPTSVQMSVPTCTPSNKNSSETLESQTTVTQTMMTAGGFFPKLLELNKRISALWDSCNYGSLHSRPTCTVLEYSTAKHFLIFIYGQNYSKSHGCARKLQIWPKEWCIFKDWSYYCCIILGTCLGLLQFLIKR